MHAPSRHASGLTLIEMLVALCLIALTAGAVGATFAGGMRVWERLRAQEGRDQWLQIAFDQFRRDLHNVRAFHGIPFKGEYDALSFTTLVSVDVARDAGQLTDGPSGAPGEERLELEALGQRGYFLDSGRRVLCRSERAYQSLGSGRLRDRCAPMLTGVDRVRFSYYGFDASRSEYRWTEAWSSDDPPVAVKLEVGYREPSTQRPINYALIVHLPVAAVR